MQLAPGPIPTITSDWFDQTQEDPGFSALVNDQLSELDGVEGDMDALIDPGLVIDAALPDDGLDGELATADLTIAAIGNQAAALPFDAIDAAQQRGDEALSNVYDVIPAEAYTPVPPPLDVPDAQPVDVVANPMQVTLANDARPGASDFTAGDAYTIQIHIPASQGGGGIFAGVAVTEYAWKDNQAQPKLDLGFTDQFGFLNYKSFFGPGDVGQWGATFYSITADGAQLAGPTLNWEVKAGALSTPVSTTTGGTATTPPSPVPIVPVTPVTVRLVNLRTGQVANTFKVGDSWTLTVTGPANSPVVIRAAQGGRDLPPATVGATDSQGVFVLAGVMSTAEIGFWVENYQVAEVTWDSSLVFSVTAS